MGSTMKKKSVCIIGAGMSGLCTCKYMVQQGLDVVVLESSGSVGGVWRSTYESTVLQNSYWTYQFSDFPWPPGTPRHPSHRQVLAYFEAYAQHFSLMDHIRFHSKVLALRRHVQAGWIVTTACYPDLNHTHASDERNVVEVVFDFVVLCTGRFGDVPWIPRFSSPLKGPQAFQGKVLHAMEYSALSKAETKELLHGKRVAVVGFHKSALDIAMEVSDITRGSGVGMGDVVMIYRRPYWFIPENTAWEAMVAFIYFTRFSEFLHRKPACDQGLWNMLLYPLRSAISKFVEHSLLEALPLEQNGLIPDESFGDQMASCVIAKPPPSFFDRVEEGRIRLCKSPKWSFYKKGLILNDELAEKDITTDGHRQFVEVDVVILATGYDSQAKLLSLIPKSYKNHLFDSNGVLPLYRGLIPCGIPDMAIVGYQMNFGNIHSSEMGARWLSYLLASRIKLPDQKCIKEEAQILANYVRTSAFPRHSCLGLVQIWYADQLCKDMGWNPRRKKNFFQELFCPYTNMDYCGQ